MAGNSLYFGLITVVLVLTGGQLLSSYVSRTNTHQLLSHQQNLQSSLDSQALHVKQLQESIVKLKEKHRDGSSNSGDDQEVKRLRDKLGAEEEYRKSLEKKLKALEKGGSLGDNKDEVIARRKKQLAEAGPFHPELKSMPEVVEREPAKRWFKRFQSGTPRDQIKLDTCTKFPDPCRTPNTFKNDGNALHTTEKQIHHHRKLHFKNLHRLFDFLPDLRKEAKTLFDRVQRNNTILVVPINRGYFDFFLNWWASCQLAKVDLTNLVVFAADAGLDAKVRELGLTSFYHDGLGEYPVRSASLFGDTVFTQMMWLKTLSVWLVLDTGYDVLFQDADLVWFDDPVQYIKDSRYWLHDVQDLGETYPPQMDKTHLVDCFFMDDGSRSTRFYPYYANSGFFFLRSNRRTLKYWDSVMFQNDLTLDWQSQQQLVNIYLISSCQFGLRTVSLCSKVFMHGPLSIDLERGKLKHEQLKPVVWHVNYTPDRGTKQKRMEDMGIWFLDREKWPAPEEAKKDQIKRDKEAKLQADAAERRRKEREEKKNKKK